MLQELMNINVKIIHDMNRTSLGLKKGFGWL